MSDIFHATPGMSKRDARRWIREHWAYLIAHADMGAVGEMEIPALDSEWSDECLRIATRLRGKS